MKRRNFLQSGILAASSLKAFGPRRVFGAGEARKKLAAIAASCALRSPADNLITRFLEGYWLDNDFHQSPCEIASVYVDRIAAGDIAHRLAAAYQFPVMPSISDALTLGTGNLAVDGVLLVGESGVSPAHTSTPARDLRFEFFAQVVAAFKKFGRSVPVFCAGYLSDNWDHVWQSYQWSRELGFPLMAGSTPAVTFRRPEVDYPLPSGFDDALLGDQVHHNDPLGVDFADALIIAPGVWSSQTLFASVELLQAFIERRRAGESGIRSIDCRVGQDAWRAAEKGRWSKDLMLAAGGRSETPGDGPQKGMEDAVVWLIEYHGGTRGAILSLGDFIREYLAAFSLKGREETDSTLCYTPADSGNDYSMLVHGIEQMMTTQAAPVPAERAVLASGAMAVMREAALARGRRVETPMLRIAYVAPERSFYARGRGW
jgi:hypothetical protein